ncbi:uncharacterized protein [Cardiocondyla obscurior]|uniref:uncharacterized protein n=1 Tax=Cardiocondyla obscurior TaxID=286306 RepID=UPI00396565E1
MDHYRKLIILLLLTISISSTHGIIGYDCGSAAANLTTLSLIDLEECDIPTVSINTTQVYLQLLQIDDFTSVKVIQCKVEIDRMIKKCGMFSHTMEVHNGKYSYIHEVSREVCQHMHLDGTFTIGNTLITGLKPNATASRPVVLAGSVDNDGACSGAAYSDPYGTWEQVIVLSTIKITLQDYSANIRLNSNQVLLRSGVVCELKATRCTDMEGGNTFWEPQPGDTCNLRGYSLLYRGIAESITDYNVEPPQIVYTINQRDIVFALTRTGEYTSCGFTLTQTEHPKLVIFLTDPNGYIFKNYRSSASYDLFTYVNSKFVYVERHVRQQFNLLYRNVILEQCRLELQLLRNSLAIATQSPDIFAFHFMKGPGYMAVSTGEVIHIIKCVPTEVKIASTEECYDQLPVIRGNETYFLTPQTHILLQQGTQINCNPLAPAMFRLDNSWYKFLPRPVESVRPTVMKPMTRPTWKYVSPGSLATSGIYTQTDLDDLKNHIMFPAERPAILNTLARGIMGEPTLIQGGSISNLIDKASIERIAISTWQKFWSKFLIFGNISAGLMGIYLTCRAIKLLIDTLVHGYALHTVYGWSIYLIGAIWDSITNLLLHLGKGRNKYEKASAPKQDPETTFTQNHLEMENLHPKVYPTIPVEKTATYTFELKE